MALTPGTRLGPYEVVTQIGVGGMGEVYKATDTNLKRSVAIKVLPTSVAGDADRLARFQREAEVLAALNHPNIAAIYGLERSGSMTALVMELVEGPTLADRIAQGAIPIDEALPIAKQIAEGLEAAHELGIIHRDLKPANIKVRTDGTVKVLDFGLAKAMDPTAGSSASASMSPTITSPAMMTGVGVLLGTAAYMSPEQARGKTVDKRADIWAFGAVLFEMLTGQRAFGGEDVAETLANVINKEPAWEALPTAVSARVSQTLRLCLRKPPRERVPDIGAVRLALEGAFETVVAPLANEAGGGSRKATAVLRAWQVVAGLLMLTTVTGAAAWWSVSRPVTPSMTRFFVYPPEKTTFVTAGRAGASVAISPDGRRLAFTARDGSGKVLLWVRPIDSLTAQPLPGTDDAAFPFWSPDSRSIAYFAQDKLFRIDATGGPPQTVCVAPSSRGGAWSRDDVIVFGSLFGVTPGALSRVPAAGGQPVVLTKLEGSQVDHRFPSFLPDGRHVLFFAQANSPESGGIYLASLDSGASTRLLAANSGGIYVSPGYLLFTRDATLLAQPFDTQRLEVMGAAVPIAERVESTVFQGVLAFSVSAGGTLVYGSGAGASSGQQMTFFDRQGKPLEDVGPVADYRGVDLSPDGTRVAAHRQDGVGGDIWVTDLVRHTTSRFTFDASQENKSPIWSADGTRIAYDSNRNGDSGTSFGTYAKPANGAGVEERLVDNVGRATVWSWAPDRSVIVYEANGDLWTVGLTGDKKPAPLTHTQGINESMGQISPDGKWLAYQSNETSRGEVYVQPFPSGAGKWQVSTNGGGWPRWRRDSGELFYQQATGNRMMAVEVTSRGGTFEAGTPRDLFATPYVNLPHATGPYQAYAVSADGQRFLFPHPRSNNESDLTMPIAVVENWAAGFRK